MNANYEGVESLGFFTEPQLSAYRQMLLDKTFHQVAFIQKHVIPAVGRPRIDVVEVGCGNGRLLIALSLEDLLNRGWGLDLAASRIEFAKKWYDDLPWKRPILWRTANVLELKYSPCADLVVCITGCFNYFNPKIEASKALYFMKHTGKYSLFELYKWPKKTYRVNRTLPAEDPFESYNSHYIYHPSKHGFTEHRKTFICRDGAVDQRQEIVYHWSLNEFTDALFIAGYKSVDWAVEDSERMVVLAHG